MLEKKRLLQQFLLPSDRTEPFGVEWTRGRDFFGDHFALRAQVRLDSIHFDYLHKAPDAEAERPVWSITIGLGPTGRAKVASSIGVAPEVRSVHRAAAMIEQATRHLQANPSAPEPATRRARSGPSA